MTGQAVPRAGAGHTLVLGAGEVLVRSPAAVRQVNRLLQAGVRVATRGDGLSLSPLVRELLAAFGEAASLAATSSPEVAEVPEMPRAPTSDADLIGTVEVARMLNCGERNARDLCRRGHFDTAQMTGRSWLVDRAEVQAEAGRRQVAARVA